MATITVMAGARTIGGTLIAVDDGEARLVFDCGLAYDPVSYPFAHVAPRPWRTLADLQALGLVPSIPGLFTSTADGVGPPLAVAVSHAHLDHSHLAGLVAPRVPLYGSPATTRLVRVLGQLAQTLTPVERPFTAVQPDEWIVVGLLRLRLAPVDHDVEGARGLLVETSDGVIAYSGDLRLHGMHPQRTLAFAQAARDAGARLLILEGTTLWPSSEPGAQRLPEPGVSERTEADVAPMAAQALREAAGRLCVVLLTPENGERVEALAWAATETGRLLLLDPEGLAVAMASLGRPLDVPYALYLPTRLARLLEGGGERGLAACVREALMASVHVVTARAIVADPGAFLLRLPFGDFADLLDLLPARAGGALILANGTPLGRFDPAWGHMEWWAGHLGLRIVDCACSGHATPGDLARIAAQVGAPTVMAVHSHYPELLKAPGARLLLPEVGRPYDLLSLPTAG